MECCFVFTFSLPAFSVFLFLPVISVCAVDFNVLFAILTVPVICKLASLLVMFDMEI